MSLSTQKACFPVKVIRLSVHVMKTLKLFFKQNVIHQCCFFPVGSSPVFTRSAVSQHDFFGSGLKYWIGFDLDENYMIWGIMTIIQNNILFTKP